MQQQMVTLSVGLCVQRFAYMYMFYLHVPITISVREYASTLSMRGENGEPKTSYMNRGKERQKERR